MTDSTPPAPERGLRDLSWPTGITPKDYALALLNATFGRTNHAPVTLQIVETFIAAILAESDSRIQAAVARRTEAIVQHRPMYKVVNDDGWIEGYVICSCGQAKADGVTPYDKLWGDHIRALSTEAESAAMAQHDAALERCVNCGFTHAEHLPKQPDKERQSKFVAVTPASILEHDEQVILKATERFDKNA